MLDLIGLIPAAGKGLRLGLPYPKELYPIIRDNRYKPVSQFVLENLTASGVQHIVFVINETKHQLIGYFGNGSRFGCDISYVVQEQREPNNSSTSPGLAHALDSAYHLARRKMVYFGMADTIITPMDIFRQMSAASHSEDDVVLGLFKTTRPEKFGMVDFDQSGRVRQVIDKPSMTNLQYMWGCIIWHPDFTELLHCCVTREAVADFAQVLNTAIQEGLRVRGVCFDQGSYVDLGTYEEIAELERRHRAT